MASSRRACVDAFAIMLKSEEPSLRAEEQQLFRGMQNLGETSLAQEIIKRRRTYVINACRRHFRALTCTVSAGGFSTVCNKFCMTADSSPQMLHLLCTLVTVCSTFKFINNIQEFGYD
jgi:hypothetical protein